MSSEIACVVIPTLNEAQNIVDLIPKVFACQKKVSSHELHVLIVDGASTDGTQTAVIDLKKEFLNLDMIVCEKRGLGEAYKYGFNHLFKHMNPDLIFEMDADGQHDPNMIPIFIQLIRYGFDCVIGSRFAAGGKLINFSFKSKMLRFN